MLVHGLAIGSAVLYGAADFAGGLATRQARTIPVVALSQASGLVLLALMLPFLTAASPSRADWFWGLAAGLTGGAGVALLYRALAIGTMAVVAPTTAVCAVTLPVAISVLAGERPAPLAFAGIALGILSIVLVSRQQTSLQPVSQTSVSTFQLPRGVGTAFVSGVAIGFFFLSLAQTRSAAGMWPLVGARSLSTLLFGAAAIASGQSLRLPRRITWLAIGCGVVDVLANAFYMLAAQQGPLSVVVTLSSLYPASTVLLARIVLGERLNTWQVSGVACAVAAVLLIVSARH